MRNNILIITTKGDISLSQFLTPEVTQYVNPSVIYYEQNVEDFTILLKHTAYQIVYFRDPFNTDSYDLNKIRQQIDVVKQLLPDAYYVDRAQSFEDVLFEDKWRQYELLKDFMPMTKLLQNASEIIPSKYIGKKRISSRARGIAFNPQEVVASPNDYIIQQIMNIKRELRVYVVNHAVLPLASVRTSKTPLQKVKVMGLQNISPECSQFAKKIDKALKHFDFYGIDIIETEENDIFILEVNRSCQFNRYNQLTGNNVIVQLVKELY